MKPKPLSALNHFTVPVAISSSPLSVMPRGDCPAPSVSLPAPGLKPALFPVVVFRSINRHRRRRAARAYMEELMPHILSGEIRPGRVFDRTVPLGQVAEGYRRVADPCHLVGVALDVDRAPQEEFASRRRPVAEPWNVRPSPGFHWRRGFALSVVKAT